MYRKSLIALVPGALLCTLAACGQSPGGPSTPVDTPPTMEPVPSEPATASSESNAADDGDTMSPESSTATDAGSPEPSTTTDVAAVGIPSEIQGKWITVGEGEEPKECTQEREAAGAIITIDATEIASFAFIFDLESVEDSDATSMVGVFSYSDDTDEEMTPRIRLQSDDDWQTLEFIALDTEGQEPAIYARCP